MEKNLSHFIRTKSHDSGFIRCTFAKYEQLNEEGIKLKSWLDEGRNADMKWIYNTFEKRKNPALIMEDIKSVVSLAYVYDTPVLHTENPDIPKISRYAWGSRDYHNVLKKKLKTICSDIESEFTGVKTRYYVDDGPVMDKAWAVRSGLGWLGKNTNVINKDFGSFFFIAIIFTNAKLEYDKPADDLCGSCNLCINSCPTGAIYNDYKVDANLCISYQTIENKNDIPDSVDTQGWIFGCDVCQDVCPFNGKKVFTDEACFYPLKEIKNKTFDELLNFSENDFNFFFKGTPVKRTKYKGWIRNLNKAR